MALWIIKVSVFGPDPVAKGFSHRLMVVPRTAISELNMCSPRNVAKWPVTNLSHHSVFHPPPQILFFIHGEHVMTFYVMMMGKRPRKWPHYWKNGRSNVFPFHVNLSTSYQSRLMRWWFFFTNIFPREDCQLLMNICFLVRTAKVWERGAEPRVMTKNKLTVMYTRF